MKFGSILAFTLAGAMLYVPALAAQQQQVPGPTDGPLTENPQYNQQCENPAVARQQRSSAQ